MYWYLKVSRQYADFNGRARRKEFWMFGLLNLIFAITAMILDKVFGTKFGTQYYGMFYYVYGLAVFVIRLHDVGKIGWWYFIMFIPIIGVIWMFILLRIKMLVRICM